MTHLPFQFTLRSLKAQLKGNCAKNPDPLKQKSTAGCCMADDGVSRHKKSHWLASFLSSPMHMYD